MSDNGDEWEALYLNLLTLGVMQACSHNTSLHIEKTGETMLLLARFQREQKIDIISFAQINAHSILKNTENT